MLSKRTIHINDIQKPTVNTERDGLLDDIKKNGLRTRVWLKETDTKYFIRDGNHRMDCCLKLGIVKIPALITKKNVA